MLMDVMMCECCSCERFTAATCTHYLSPFLLLECAKKKKKSLVNGEQNNWDLLCCRGDCSITKLTLAVKIKMDRKYLTIIGQEKSNFYNRDLWSPRCRLVGADTPNSHIFASPQFELLLLSAPLMRFLHWSTRESDFCLCCCPLDTKVFFRVFKIRSCADV